MVMRGNALQIAQNQENLIYGNACGNTCGVW